MLEKIQKLREFMMNLLPDVVTENEEVFWVVRSVFLMALIVVTAVCIMSMFYGGNRQSTTRNFKLKLDELEQEKRAYAELDKYQHSADIAFKFYKNNFIDPDTEIATDYIQAFQEGAKTAFFIENSN